jgi:hypothetical protein
MHRPRIGRTDSIGLGPQFRPRRRRESLAAPPARNGLRRLRSLHINRRITMWTVNLEHVCTLGGRRRIVK